MPIKASRVRKRVSLSFSKPSLTKQAFKAECDINNILAKWRKTGLIEHVQSYGGQYGDFSGFTDYHDSINRVMAADDMFKSLPSHLRAKFKNDPGSFVDFCSDPANKDELVKLGLATSVGVSAAPPHKAGKETPAAPEGGSESPSKGSKKNSEQLHT